MVDLQRIQSKIYEIRGHKVMINRDLAELYQVTTGNLNKSVQRNIKRFPSDFMFQLTKEEFDQLKTNLIFQNGISNWGGTRKLPYAFTEQGPAMLSGISNSDTAIQVNINIMRAFVAMRRLISNPPVDKNAELREEMKKLKDYMEEIFADQNDINEDNRIQLELINQTLAELQVHQKLSDKPRRPILFIRQEENELRFLYHP